MAILVVPDQRLSEREHLRWVGCRVGRCRSSDLRAVTARSPELIKIRNMSATPPRLRDGAMHWHCDSLYEAESASITMLHALEAPASGNDTLFAETVAAYGALPDETKARIDSL